MKWVKEQARCNLKRLNPLGPKAPKIKIRELALTDLLAKFIKETVDFDTH